MTNETECMPRGEILDLFEGESERPRESERTQSEKTKQRQNKEKKLNSLVRCPLISHYTATAEAHHGTSHAQHLFFSLIRPFIFLWISHSLFSQYMLPLSVSSQPKKKSKRESEHVDCRVTSSLGRIQPDTLQSYHLSLSISLSSL